MAIPSVNQFANIPGGGINAAMRANNSLANEMILRRINKIKEQYAPITAQAEAASKLAYSNLVNPQYIAKIMGNPEFMANLSDEQKNSLKNLAYNAGIRNQGIMPMQNALAQQQDSQGFTGFLKNSLQNAFGLNNQQPAGAMMPNSGNQSSDLSRVMSGIAHVESRGAKNPYQLIGKDTGKGEHALGKYQIMSSNVPEWTKEALGQSMTPQDFLNSPEAQEKVAAYMMNKYLKQGYSPQDVGSIWFTGKPLAKAGNVRDVYGTSVPDYINKMNEGMGAQGRTPSFAENAGNYKGTIKQKEQEGKYRADALHAIGQSQFALSKSGDVLDRLTGIITNPTFANMRNKIPGFQNSQLEYLKFMGNPEEKELIGDFLATAEKFIESTVQGFGGKPLVREFELAQRQKITPSDTVESATGKLRSARALHDIAEKKNQIVSDLLQRGYNESDAIKQANKMIDVSAIEKETNKRLQRKIKLKNNKTGETKEFTLEEARKMGVPNV